jgi:hypothetical protein
MNRGFLVLLAIGTPFAASIAQQPKAAAPARRSCFHARPVHRCDSFWITEMGPTIFVNPPAYAGSGVMIGWDIGRMVNRSPTRATGASVFLATNDNQFRFGARARYRTWLGSRAALDLAPGLIVFHSDRDLDVRLSPGANFLATMSAFEWLRVNGQVEVTRGGPRALLGVSLGSHAGTAIGLVLPVLFIWVAAHDNS